MVRDMRETDAEALARLYNRLAASIPYHPAVGAEQFAEELEGFAHPEARECSEGAPRRAFVAERAGVPVALAMTCVLTRSHPWDGMVEGRGALRFLLAGPEEEEAARSVIRAATTALGNDGASDPVAMHYVFGPPFHNTGCAMLPAAWPWLGHWLYLEGYGATKSEIRMRLAMADRPDPLPLPEGADLRPYKPDHPFKTLDPFHDFRHLYIDGRNAAQCHNHYAEHYVRGAGKSMFYTTWLGVNEGFRGRGLGRAMLRQALRRAYDEGCRVATLTTAGTNFRAQALYVSEGYVQTDTLWAFERRAPA